MQKKLVSNSRFQLPTITFPHTKQSTEFVRDIRQCSQTVNSYNFNGFIFHCSLTLKYLLRTNATTNPVISRFKLNTLSLNKTQRRQNGQKRNLSNQRIISSHFNSISLANIETKNTLYDEISHICSSNLLEIFPFTND